MPNAAPDWLPRAILVVLGVTALRIVLLALNRTDLFVDESQYWFWGQSLDFGYYSKPPLIAWIIRAATEIGTDSPFWIRLPGPLCHAATALILGAIAARLAGARAALWTAALWVTLPMVTVGSTLASTDTVMMPWLALALLAWLRTSENGSLGWAALAGIALGIGFLGKYAAAYYVIGACLATLIGLRLPMRAVVVALAGFVLAISPNLLWNLGNGFATVEHTLDNADWVRAPGQRASFNLEGLAEFFASQFIVFGPVLFAGLLWCALRWGRRTPPERQLLAFALPVLALVCGQAFLSQAYANWAATAYLAGLLVVVPWLLARHPVWLWGTLALHGAFALFIPLATAFGTGWGAGPDNRLLLARYLGRSDMSADLLARARDAGLPMVADDRDILADLFYAGRDGAVAIYAKPVAGRPPNHYVQTQSLPRDVEGEVLFVSKRKAPPQACPEAEPFTLLAPEQGAYRDRPQRLYRLDATCLHD